MIKSSSVFQRNDFARKLPLVHSSAGVKSLDEAIADAVIYGDNGSIRECGSTPYVGMTHPLNINNDRLTSLFLQKDRMEGLTQRSRRSLGSSAGL